MGSKKQAVVKEVMKCLVTAVLPQGRKYAKRFEVKAADRYQAIDLITAQIGEQQYAKLSYVVFKFGKPKLFKLSDAAQAAVDNAGAEEE